MKMFLGLIMALTFFITFTVGSICNGLIRYPEFPTEYYFSLSKMSLNLVASLVFTGIFIFLTPAFQNLVLLKKIIVRIAIANSLLCCILPLLIYLLSTQGQSGIFYNYYNWLIIVFSMVVLLGAIYLNKIKAKDRI